MKKMKDILTIAVLIFSGFSALCQNYLVDFQSNKSNDSLIMDKELLKDKIKGGWAGQTIGVTFGGPTEFKFNGTFIQEYQPIAWYDGYLKETMEGWPGLYDDVYMDLTFVEVIEREGLDAPAESYAKAFSHADFNLWHANQAARYNFLNGIMPPESGHWMNNPHADDIDFQIEADFIGLMSPGMPSAAAQFGDPIGHIMNYGDGWYGGVYVSALYSLAFTSNDIEFIVSEALKTIPEQSDFYKCIRDVIEWHKEYPEDWKQNWMEIQKKWSSDIGCPKGVFAAFDIDAKINAAYAVLGLLYGNGDYSKTLEIATRAGNDSDCNPSTAAGILGTIIGYENIPRYWKMGLPEIEDMNFKYTSTSLNKVYDVGFEHALKMIERNGGEIKGNEVVIKVQTPNPVRYEKSFEGLYPVEKVKFPGTSEPEKIVFDFEGTGFALTGYTAKGNRKYPDYSFNTEVFIDGKKMETVVLNTNFIKRRYDLFWKYGLENKKHRVEIKILNPNKDYGIRIGELLTYSDEPKPSEHN